MLNKIPNVTELGIGLHLVRSQAGLRKVLKKYVDLPLKCYNIINPPVNYPCVVNIQHRSWSTDIFINHISVNELRKRLDAGDPPAPNDK